jgi:hypothetical protein
MGDGVTSVVLNSSYHYGCHMSSKQGNNIDPLQVAICNKTIKEATKNWDDNYGRFLTVFA